ncbi:TRAP transporter small permease [Pelagibacterium xiamenense]|uniref:TRAP transporter small permease n=1 Tax=Pelagibacterium xiamenense TaxID=2901140 RepID=UPI001E3BC02E|nr:TRAP transporter small permease subunit [Pelagibacterium xiamenense]MCD7059581.1 TRAP transporter small permease subunit [Pelagibacterium xiamenense]
MTALKRIASWLYSIADGLSAVLLTAMFVTFIIQVVMRYVFNYPVGWTVEVQTIAWIWVILWGQSVTVSEADEIRFDIVYSSVSEPVRRIFRLIFSAFIVGIYAIALPAIWDYVTFMKIEETSYLDLRFDYVFSVYVIFTIAVIIRYGWIFYRSVRGKKVAITAAHDTSEPLES